MSCMRQPILLYADAGSKSSSAAPDAPSSTPLTKPTDATGTPVQRQRNASPNCEISSSERSLVPPWAASLIRDQRPTRCGNEPISRSRGGRGGGRS